MASGSADALIYVGVRVNSFKKFTTNKTKQDVLVSTTCAPNNLGGIFMTNVISQQDLLEKIVSVSQGIFEHSLVSNPNEFSYDDEKCDRKFHLRTQKMRCRSTDMNISTKNHIMLCGLIYSMIWILDLTELIL